MNLIITDHADESVGIFPASYAIEAPIPYDYDMDEIEEFRKRAIDLYAEFAAGKVTALYDFELERMENYYNNECFEQPKATRPPDKFTNA